MIATEPEWAARFRAKVDLDGPIPARRPELGPCHAWTKSLTNDGYGRFFRCGRTVVAHLCALELAGVDVPPLYEADHLCRNRACVNLAHLEPVTRQVNRSRSDHWSAIVARTNHCKAGHEFTEKNTYIKPTGQRACRKCRSRRTREWKARKRAAKK